MQNLSSQKISCQKFGRHQGGYTGVGTPGSVHWSTETSLWLQFWDFSLKFSGIRSIPKAKPTFTEAHAEFQPKWPNRLRDLDFECVLRNLLGNFRVNVQRRVQAGPSLRAHRAETLVDGLPRAHRYVVQGVVFASLIVPGDDFQESEPF